MLFNSIYIYIYYCFIEHATIVSPKLTRSLHGYIDRSSEKSLFIFWARRNKKLQVERPWSRFILFYFLLLCLLE